MEIVRIVLILKPSNATQLPHRFLQLITLHTLHLTTETASSNRTITLHPRSRNLNPLALLLVLLRTLLVQTVFNTLRKLSTPCQLRFPLHPLIRRSRRQLLRTEETNEMVIVSQMEVKRAKCSLVGVWKKSEMGIRKKLKQLSFKQVSR